MLQGCGFTPVYATPEAGGSTASELAAIRINEVGEGSERRIGQILRNELIDRFTAGVGPQPVEYDLVIEISQTASPLQIQTTDTVTRYNLVLSASFILRDAASFQALYQGSAKSTGSYDVVESEYATLVAERDSGREAARDLSNTIANLLSLYFSREDAG